MLSDGSIAKGQVFFLKPNTSAGCILERFENLNLQISHRGIQPKQKIGHISIGRVYRGRYGETVPPMRGMIDALYHMHIRPG